MLVGVKLGPLSPKGYAEKIKSFADYFEIYAKLNYDTDFFKKIGKPMVIHIPHEVDGVNLPNPSRREDNIRHIRHAITLAERFGSDKIVFHPGYLDDPSCSIEVLKKVVKDNFDKRLLVECMPDTSAGFAHLGRSFEELKEIIEETGVGFCMDFSHALAYARKAGLEEEAFLKKLLLLKPAYFHLTDTVLSEVFNIGYNEKHRTLFEGDVDLGMVSRLLPRDAMVTLETPQVLEKQIKEIRFLKSLQ